MTRRAPHHTISPELLAAEARTAVDGELVLSELEEFSRLAIERLAAELDLIRREWEARSWARQSFSVPCPGHPPRLSWTRARPPRDERAEALLHVLRHHDPMLLASDGSRWHVDHITPPIPLRSYDWCASHESYDGAPDAKDRRVAYGPTLGGLVEAVEAKIRELAEEDSEA